MVSKKLIIHPQIRVEAQRGIAWAKAFLNRVDTSKVDRVRIDFGRLATGKSEPQTRGRLKRIPAARWKRRKAVKRFIFDPCPQPLAPVEPAKNRTSENRLW